MSAKDNKQAQDSDANDGDNTSSSGGAFGDQLNTKIILKDAKLADNNLLMVARKAINRLMAGAKALIGSSSREHHAADQQRGQGHD